MVPPKRQQRHRRATCGNASWSLPDGLYLTCADKKIEGGADAERFLFQRRKKTTLVGSPQGNGQKLCQTTLDCTADAVEAIEPDATPARWTAAESERGTSSSLTYPFCFICRPFRIFASLHPLSWTTSSMSHLQCLVTSGLLADSLPCHFYLGRMAILPPICFR